MDASWPFSDRDNGRSFEKINSWDKSDLHCGSTVLSIEGSALRVTKRRVEVLVSTEKVRTYPKPAARFPKAGNRHLEHRSLQRHTRGKTGTAGAHPAATDQLRPRLSARQRSQYIKRFSEWAHTAHLLRTSLHVVVEHVGVRHVERRRTQPHRFRFLSARLYLGRSGHAHYLPATRPPRRCLCQSPSAVALLLRRRRVPTPARRAQEQRFPSARILLRRVGRLGLRV